MREFKELESLREWCSHLSLRAKVTGVAIAVSTLPLLVVGGAGVAQIRHVFASAAQRSADALSLSFSHAAELQMAGGDVKNLGRLTGNFMRDPSLVFVAAYDVRGKLLTSAARDPSAWQSFQTGNLNTEACIISRRTVATADAGNDLEASPKLMGTIVIGLSPTALGKGQASQSFLMVMLTALAAGVGGLVLYMANGPWMRRLQKLAEASASIKGRAFNGELSDYLDDEVGQIAQSIDLLLSDLRKRDQKIAQMNADLLLEKASGETQPATTGAIGLDQASETGIIPTMQVRSVPVDLELLTRRCVNNRRLAAKALRIFDNGIDRDLEILTRSVQDRDPKAMAESAHKIEDAAAHISAEDVRRMAAELEKLARDDSLEQSEQTLQQLLEQVNTFRSFLQTAFEQLTPVETQTVKS